MDVYAVAYELAAHAVCLDYRPKRPWLTVVQRAHRVEAVGRVCDAQGYSLSRLLVRRVRVSDAHGDARLHEPPGHLMAAWQLRREGNQPEPPCCKLEDTLRLPLIRQAQPLGQVRPAPLGTDIRPLQVDAHGLCAGSRMLNSLRRRANLRLRHRAGHAHHADEKGGRS